MGIETKIQWCSHTFNPWRGCRKISPGCANCYAEVLGRRNPSVLGSWGPGGRRAIAAESYWRQPVRWDRAAREAIFRDFTPGQRRAGEHLAARPRVFCASLADVFEDRQDLEAPRARLFDLIDRTPFLDWLLLTKRPEDIGRLWPEHPGVEEDADGEVIGLHVAGRDCEGTEGDCCWGSGWLPPLPRPIPSRSFRNNAWLGVSVEDQDRADGRIPALLRIPAVVRFLSVEPLLGPIDLSRFLGFQHEDEIGVENTDQSLPREQGVPFHDPWVRGIDWVIVGGESGHGARPCDLAWIRSIVGQCEAAGVPVFVKQLGAHWVSDGPDWNRDRHCPGWSKHDPKGGDPSEWPEDLRIRQFPAVPAREGARP